MSEPITDLPVANSIDPTQDTFPIVNNGLDETQQINRNVFLEITGDPLGTTDSQVVTNKTIGTTNTVTQLDSAFTLQDNSDPTKQAQFQLSGISAATTRTFTFPDANATLVGAATTQTLTNKTLTSPTITGGSISNSTVSVDSIAEYTSGNGVTIDGLNIKDSKLNTNNSVVNANITDAAVTPAKLLAGTGTSWTWQTWTPTLANMSGGTITYAKYIQIGKTVHYRFKYTLAGAGMGTAPSFTLPIAAANEYNSADGVDMGVGSYYDSSGSTAYPLCTLMISSTTVVRLFIPNAASTYLGYTQPTATVPITWAVSDSVQIGGTYEVT